MLAHFIRKIIDQDRARDAGCAVVTRFPPEPNGHLHIGHAKSVCLNFGLARDYGGACSMRFDDTNPCRENAEFVASIKDDVRWLGGDWGERLFFASDYFERLYQFAVELIQNGDAYVCSLSADEIRAYRGTLTEPGRDSPWRGRGVDENLRLFAAMRAGKFGDGEHVLRAKIDMASPNINMRDPTLYRIRRARHHATGDAWPIYPLYDFTHCLCDALEGVTHSLCTLEFEDHRPLYDWVLAHVSAPCRPRQIEFARLSLEYTVMSKRLLARLVDGGQVAGWDDPRMPTIKGLRRRGFTARAINEFCNRIGVTRSDNLIELSLLENCVREDLDAAAPRRMAVLNPLKVVIENYPPGQSEEFDAPEHPAKPELGARKIPFCREIYIEREDFMEQPAKKFHRLAPGREVRLRYACYITCHEVVHGGGGEVAELRCTYDPQSRGGGTKDGRKVKSTLHWVSARHAVRTEVRLYEKLFLHPNPAAEIGAGRDFTAELNPDSLRVLKNCALEPSLAEARPGESFQFERLGYFCADAVDSTAGRPVFNRTVTLRETRKHK